MPAPAVLATQVASQSFLSQMDFDVDPDVITSGARSAERSSFLLKGQN